MNVALMALIKLAKLLYPFIKESILGQDSVLTILRKRKVFVFVVVSNLALFLTTAFLAEQNFILLDRLKALGGELAVKDKNYSELKEKNNRLIGILKGDMDEICFAHVFGNNEKPVEEQRHEVTETSYKPSTDQEQNTEPELVDQRSFNEE
jgi:hypothetical protein